MHRAHAVHTPRPRRAHTVPMLCTRRAYAVQTYSTGSATLAELLDELSKPQPRWCAGRPSAVTTAHRPGRQHMYARPSPEPLSLSPQPQP